ncbi:unnamed protein product [Paramecium primaurelia]|uniref:Uncharacterized protein n=2 Tax=Paramecium TaxID=5884 RepID=A0A8S1UFF2_9CILI|nr:unnamed protein product [Paramecium primaurelia]CAD8161386.1 unnamed protein product [Paramecium pentaurelia]
MHSESVRQKAIRYINELQTEEDDKFLPYKQERDHVGLLLNTKRKSKSTNQLNLGARIKHVYSLASITKQQPSQSMKQNALQKHKKENSAHNLDLSLLVNLQPPSPEEQVKAKQYKDMMEKKALLEMYERKKDTKVMSPVLEEMIEKLNSSITQDKFVWKMSNVDKGKNLGYLFHESKLRKHNRKVQKLQPSLPNYEPNYQAILPKSISILIKPSEKPSYSQQIQEFIRKNQLDKESPKQPLTISKKDNTLEKMYSIIQNQITREVNQSLISNPQSMNPLEEFSAKPIEDTYIQQFHLQVKQKMKETNRARKNIQNKIQEFDSYLQKHN